MKMNITKALIGTVLPVLLLNLWQDTAWSQPAGPEAKPVGSHSEFVIPSNPKQGCDPFFPDSLRPFQGSVQPGKSNVELSSLIFRGISGPTDHRYAVINNHTFAQGDEGDVLTSQGRIHLRCVEIKANSVIVEFSGQRHELIFNGK